MAHEFVRVEKHLRQYQASKRVRVEKYFYKRQYQRSTGDWSTLYYGIFTDWKGVRREFALGDDLQSAKDLLGEKRRLNRGRFDFDQEKAEREKKKIKAMTLAEWLERYLKLMEGTPSWGTKKAQCAHLKRLLGSLPITEVNRVRIIEYKQRP